MSRKKFRLGRAVPNLALPCKVKGIWLPTCPTSAVVTLRQCVETHGTGAADRPHCSRMRPSALFILLCSLLSAQSTVMQHAKIIDRAGHVLENAELVIAGERIAGINGPIPKGAAIIDAKGKTIIPGPINAHGIWASRKTRPPIPRITRRKTLPRSSSSTHDTA
jgi:hypothetical protein